MAAARCTECGKPLVYEDGSPKPAGTLTDSVKCRSARARRLKREAKKRGGDKRSAHVAEISDKLKEGDALHEAAVEEFRPLVREAMTEQVLQGIGSLVGMSSAALAALEADLSSSDETIRQRAYTLWFKYTMGNPSVAPPSQQQAPAGMNVVFNVPRPGDLPAGPVSVEVAAEDLRPCGDCKAEKPSSQFVAGSNRCETCHEGMRALLTERFGDAYAG